MRDIQLRSAPAQKFAPLLRKTIARADAFVPIDPNRSIASPINSSLNAL